MCAYESMNVFVHMSVYECREDVCMSVLKRVIVCACERRDALMHGCRDI